MTRWLAGSFDPDGRLDSSRVSGALAPHPSTLAVHGPLHVAYTGPLADPVHTGPAADPHPTVCLLDGYLDNAARLRAELQAPAGCTCEELLAAGWRRWGVDLPARMRGDFALLVWDCAREQGLLARDQLGVRSLFLCETAGGLRFASEIRHLLALLPRRPPPDRASLAHWLTMSNRPGTATLYAGVRRLNPGAALLLDRTGWRERTYWGPRFEEPLEGSEGEIAERLHGALERSVRRRIGADGHAGVLMSGGLDSASVAAVAATVAPGRVRAYSAVFPDYPLVDESELIALLRGTLDLPGITAEVRAGGLLGSALETIATWAVPLRSWGDFWALPLLRAAAGEGARVTLGGDGGDELFGPRSYLLADRLLTGHPLQAIGLVRELPGASARPPRREVARMILDMALVGALPYGLHETLQRPRRARELPDWLKPSTASALLGSSDPLAWKRLDGPRWWASAAHGLTRGIEESGIFEHQRRRAATAGLQARHPMFDLELVELGLRQPPRATLDPARNRPLLRAGMAGLLPDAVRMRPRKALFDALIVDSMAGADGHAARALLGDPASELGDYVDRRRVRQVLLDSDRLRREQPFRWMWQVWRLVNAECWLRAQAGRDAEASAAVAGASAACVRLTAAGGAESGHSYVFPP